MAPSHVLGALSGAQAVRAIAATPQLTEQLAAPPQSVALAWVALSPTHRALMDDFYGLGGQPVPHPDDMAARYGVSTRSLVDRIESIIKLMQLWIRTGYYGLPIPELYLVLRLGAEQPVQLPQLINSSANHRHWGPGRFQHINAWMIAHGYPSLIPHLDDAARARFKITG